VKKFFKIIGITIGSIVGLVVVAAAIAVWCVFTPERVTPVVRSVADQFITCEWEIDKVELTFFSTFPEFGLKVEGLYLVNPMQGSQSDTVLVAPSVVAKLNVLAYLQHNNLVVRELSLPHMRANVFINPKGECNANVFYSAPDTIPEDTTAFSLPFDSIIVNSCAIEAEQLTFLDLKDTINAQLSPANIHLNMSYWDDIHLKAKLRVESLTLKDEEYAHNLTLRLDVPAEVDLDRMYFRLKDAEVALNEFALGLNGECTIGDTIPMDVTVDACNWEIKPLLALLPSSITSSLKDIDANGLLSVNATAKGIYTEGVMPIIDAHVALKKGSGSYAALPYTLDKLTLDATGHLDLNTPYLSKVTIQQLYAHTLDSEVKLAGSISDLMGAMQTTAHAEVDAYLPDWAYFLPKNIDATAKVKGGLDIQARLSEIGQRLNSVSAKGELEVADLAVQMDSLSAQLKDATLQLDAQLKDWPVIKANLALQSGQSLTVQADSLDATLRAPKLTANAQINIQDTTSVPTISAHIQWDELKGYFKDYNGRIGYSQLDARLTNGGHKRKFPALKATLASRDIDARAMGHHLVTKSIDMDFKSMYNDKGTNVLLKLNPVLGFFLNGAEVDLNGFEKHISIPRIVFNYSNRDFNIINSSIILGNSDFSLTGNIHKIGKWMLKKDILTGELNFVSNHTDVNELLALFSANSGSEETTTTTDTTSTGPFLVPKDVDLTLNTQIKEAEVMNQTLKNLGGKIYVKDATLVLEEMGFVCDAAKLQLTAMYRTPRRNHIYAGLDYHMLDVKIDQLISMIPQIDSMVPMLRSFKGDAEFHLAVETYLNENYQLKTSTLRGACSIFGKDLVVLDSETFDKISKLLSFKKKTENKVDSISAEITLYKDEIDVYPFCVSIDNYMAAIGGRHNLDMTFDYHVNLLSPVYIGVDVKGDLDNLSIKPAKCIYAKDFRPIVHKQVDTQNAELRKIIRDSLRKNVKIQ